MFSASNMRTIGLLLALAVVIFLVHKHVQTAPAAGSNPIGGAFSAETDDQAGDSGGARQFNDQMNLVAGNPNF